MKCRLQSREGNVYDRAVDERHTRAEDRRGQNPWSVYSGRLRASTAADCSFIQGGLAILAIHPFSAGVVRPETRLCAPQYGAVGQIRVQILYKRPEIPANKGVPAIAISVTYREHKKAENPGSIPVSATNSFKNNKLRSWCTRLAPLAAPRIHRQGWNTIGFGK